MPKKKKKSWKERQRERQIRQQRAQEGYRIQREKEAERKPRQWSKGKILGAVCLISLVIIAYGAWQYTHSSTTSVEPPPINPTNPLEIPYEFSMKDINGTQFSLRGFSGKVIVIHIMGVGCGGAIDQINVNQLTQLRGVCNSFCGEKPVKLITVAVSTCPTYEPLIQLRATYGITWLFGNDYDDGKMDIAQKYATKGDGTIVLIDKSFRISTWYSTVTVSTLSSKINELLGS